ncbi:hypothetical protein KW441_02720 [Vibrio fluvialis]|nr:hypothetical protein [Vibrio fluvialis]
MDEIKALKEDLYNARQRVLDMINNEELQEACYRMARSKDYDEYSTRKRVLLELTQTIAERDSTPDIFDIYGAQRSACPLCKSYGQRTKLVGGGYKLPLGLKKHLTGESRGECCPVMKTVRELYLSRKS